MIVSFRCKKTAALYEGKRTRDFEDCHDVARRKLRMLDAAVSLNDLRAPPANRLEALTGDRRGQHSIRISGKWRLCFEWREGNAHNVEIVDYH